MLAAKIRGDDQQGPTSSGLACTMNDVEYGPSSMIGGASNILIPITGVWTVGVQVYGTWDDPPAIPGDGVEILVFKDLALTTLAFDSLLQPAFQDEEGTHWVFQFSQDCFLEAGDALSLEVDARAAASFFIDGKRLFAHFSSPAE